MDYSQLSRSALIRILQEQDASNRDAGKDGIVMSYMGRTAPWQITRLVKPKLHRILKRYSVGDEADQAVNELWDGENLSTMVTLYKHRGQVDLIVTDPPYNTGEDFRYNDKWDKDPNDPDLGNLVPKDDGSRHSKWLKFMTPRLWMMREMLKPNGVIAICIDHRELYRLGMLMDEIFKEENRIGIINWQKSYAPKSDAKHVSTATEYVLIYAKDIEKSKTGLEQRTLAMDAIYKNPDNDVKGGLWDSGKSGGNPTAASGDEKAAYGVQSPFTGEIYYPGDNYWRSAKSSMKAWLVSWGSKYEEKVIGDGLTHTDKNGKTTLIKALVLKGCKFEDGKPINSENIIKASRKAAQAIYKRGQWPKLFFTKKGDGAPRLKTYLKDVKKGKVVVSWWASEDYDEPFEIGSTSWEYTESGHSQTGIKELTAVVGPGHGFQTAKPTRLIKKIIQLWCKPDGLVLDPFAGSGTTGQAVIELNAEAASSRRFILIEQGNTEKGARPADQEVTLLMIKLLIVTGLRISELTNLKIRDVSTDASQMIVRGKGNKERIVFVPNEELQAAFRRYCVDRAKHGSLKSPLFLNAVGRRLRSQTFRKRLRVLSGRLGITPHLTPHRFRHSAATLLIEEGTDIRMVRALLGHASLRTTEIYVRVSNNALRSALESADILGAITK